MFAAYLFILSLGGVIAMGKGKIFQDFETDRKVEMDGVWIDYGNYQIRIARAGGGNKAYDVCLENKARPFRRALQNEVLSLEKQEQIVQEAFIETVILDWKGVEEVEGTPLECTQDNVRMLLKRLPDVWKDIQAQAQKVSLFRKEDVEEDAKN